MAMLKLWRATEKNLREYNSLVWKATTILEDAADSMESSGYGNLIDDVVPVLYNERAESREELNDMFISRADFERNMRYMRAIVRESKQPEYKRSVQLGYYGNLTALDVNPDTGEVYGGSFVRHQQKLARAREQRDVRKALESRGVKLNEVPVLRMNEEGEYVQAYDENRHKLTMWVPATPANERSYRDIADRDTMMVLDTPATDYDTYVDRFGDMVPSGKAVRPAPKPAEVARSLDYDAYKDARNVGYFENYRDIVNTTLPNSLSSELDTYLESVRTDLTPEQRQDLYDYIDDMGEDVASIEFLYQDMATSVNAKLTRIINFWREDIVPQFIAPYSRVSSDYVDSVLKDDEGSIRKIDSVEVDRAFADSGYIIGSGQNIMGEYARRHSGGVSTSWTFADWSNMTGIKLETKRRRGKGGK